MNQELTTIVDSKTAEDGKILALVAHFPVLGTVIAWVINLSKKNEFTSFYIRQMIGYQILTFLTQGIIVTLLGGFIAKIIGLILFVFWVLSIIGAFTSELKLMPIVGAYFQKIFRSL